MFKKQVSRYLITAFTSRLFLHRKLDPQKNMTNSLNLVWILILILYKISVQKS